MTTYRSARLLNQTGHRISQETRLKINVTDASQTFRLYNIVS